MTDHTQADKVLNEESISLLSPELIVQMWLAGTEKFLIESKAKAKQQAIIDERAKQIEVLRDWIEREGDRTNACTYNILRKVCSYCQCKRAATAPKEMK